MRELFPIMRAIGWYDLRCDHKFTKRNANYVPPQVLEEHKYRWLDSEDAMAVTLGEVLQKKGDAICLKYNYDEWSHKIRLSSIKLLADSDVRIVKGVGDCPLSFGNGPEDYAELLAGHYPAADDESEDSYGDPFEPDEYSPEYAQKLIDQYIHDIRTSEQ